MRLTYRRVYNCFGENYTIRLLPNYSFYLKILTAKKMKFSIKDFFSKSDQIRRKRRIWSNLLKKSLIENFIFCAVTDTK